MPHKDRYASYLLNTILGGGMSSRLFQKIREQQGLCYAVFSELNLYRDAGCMAIYAGTSLKSARRVVESIVRELRDKPVSADELRRAKDHLKGSFVLGLESTSSRMGNLARQQMYFQRFLSIDEMLDSIENVEAEEVRRLAGQFFNVERMTLAMLGPLDDFRLRREDLARA
jgi:predicted Zn-dependent peptidase